MEKSPEKPSGGQNELIKPRISIKIPRKRRQSSSSSSSISASSSLLSPQHGSLSNAEDERHCDDDNNNNEGTTPTKRQKLSNEKNGTSIPDHEVVVEHEMDISTGDIQSSLSAILQQEEEEEESKEVISAETNSGGDTRQPSDDANPDKEVEDTSVSVTPENANASNRNNNDNRNAETADYNNSWHDCWDNLDESGKRDEERIGEKHLQIPHEPPTHAETIMCQPRDFDVLCGRGGASRDHPGNIRFRQLVKSNEQVYYTCAIREKVKISRSIVTAIREENHGRFLERDKQKGIWYDIGDEKAIAKTSQALRDARISWSENQSGDAAAAWKAPEETSQDMRDQPLAGRKMMPPQKVRHGFGDVSSAWNDIHGTAKAMRDHARPWLIPDNSLFQNCFGGAAASAVATMNDGSNLPAGTGATSNTKFSATNIPTPPLHDFDVLFGHDDAAERHPGNETYQSLVDQFKDLYSTCPSDDEKRKISSSIVKSIQEQGGKFVEMDEAQGKWIDIGDAKAIEKTSQVLNEATLRRKGDCPISLVDDDRNDSRKSQANQHNPSIGFADQRQKEGLMTMPCDQKLKQLEQESRILVEKERRAQYELQAARTIIHRAKQIVSRTKATAVQEVEKARGVSRHYKEIAMSAQKRKEEIKAAAYRALRKAKQEFDQTKHEVATQAKELETTKGQLDAVHKSWQDQSYEIDDLKSQIETLREELATERNEREDTEQRCRTLADSLSLQAAELVHERQDRRNLEHMCNVKVKK